MFDKNKVLWGSWLVIGLENRFFFVGDIGYCSMFKKIVKRYGLFDLVVIFIGVYLLR